MFSPELVGDVRLVDAVAISFDAAAGGARVLGEDGVLYLWAGCHRSEAFPLSEFLTA